MRLLKLFGLAALVAMAAMASLGAGTASATKTVLCKENKDPCPGPSVPNGGSIYPGGTVIQAVNEGNVSLQSGAFANIYCEESEVHGKLKESTNEAQFFLKWQEIGSQEVEPIAQWQLEGEIVEKQGEKPGVSFKKCFRERFGADEPCTAEALQLPYQVELSANIPQDGNGTMEIFEQTTGSGQPGARVKCPELNFDCNFKVKEEGQEGTPKEKVGKFKVLGGAPAHVKAEQIKLKTEVPAGGSCTIPLFGEVTQGEWSATYKITEPNPAWVRHIA